MKSQEMIALDKEGMESIKRELVYLVYILIGGIILFKVIFYNESFLVTTRIAALLWWMFILPGWALLFAWHERFDFLERTVVGSVIGIAAFGVVGYNLSILGLDLKYHAVIIPLAMILAGGFVVRRTAGRKENGG